MTAKRTRTASAAQDGGKKRKKSGAKSKKRPATVVDKQKLRAQMEAAVLEKSQTVINAVIRQAEQGGYLPAKYLFEFAGIAQPLPATQATPGATSAGTLMDILLGTAKGAEETAEQGKAE